MPSPRAFVSRGRIARVVAGCLTAAGVAGACARPGDSAPPRAEFLLNAGDSTYWVATGPRGVQVRASSMLLARVGGRLYEVYAADDDRSFYDAVFTTQRVYRRDLLTGDSVAVWDDPTVARLARAHAAANPQDAPLAPDEDASDDPATVATTEVALVDVHGPYLTLEARGDFDVAGVRHQHVARRTVVDLRTGRRMSIVDLAGDSAARAVIAAGRRRLAVAIDSARTLAAAVDSEAGARAVRSLPTLRFDPASFGLGDVDGRLAVAFVVPGHDPDGRAVTLPLAPVAVGGALATWWATAGGSSIPTFAADSSEARWPLPGATHEVVARYTPERDAALVTIRTAGRSTRLAPAARRRGSWPVVRVPTPVRQLVPLDRPLLTPDARRALARAFNESTLYGEEATTASYKRGARSNAGRPIVFASHPAPRSRLRARR